MNGKSSFINNYNFSEQFLITQLIAWHDSLANKHTHKTHVNFTYGKNGFSHDMAHNPVEAHIVLGYGCDIGLNDELFKKLLSKSKTVCIPPKSYIKKKSFDFDSS